jgi:hypothetical protein
MECLLFERRKKGRKDICFAKTKYNVTLYRLFIKLFQVRLRLAFLRRKIKLRLAIFCRLRMPA